MTYPAGIEKMDDYLNRRARLRRAVELRNGKRYEAGKVVKIVGHHRGKLTLADPFETEIVLMRGMPRGTVEILWERGKRGGS